MATRVQLRRGTTSEHSTFTGSEGEVTVNTTKDTLVVHDGATAGGRELARADLDNVSASDLLTKIKTVDGSGSGLDADTLDGLSSAAFATAAQGATADAALPASSYTAADVLTKIKTVDGSGSGLDADLLDGQSSAYFRINVYDAAGNLLN